MISEQSENQMLFHIESQRKNIFEIRNWIFQLIIISVGIIGFTLGVFNTSPLIKNSYFLILSLFLLWFEIILGFGYLKKVLSKENNRLADQWEKLRKHEPLGSETKSDIKDYILDILYGIFVIATLAIILSMIDFS